MLHIIIINKCQSLIKGLLDKENTYSSKRWTAMIIIAVLLILIIVDFIFNEYKLRQCVAKLLSFLAGGLFGITLMDKHLNNKSEANIAKIKNDESKDQ